MQLKFSCEVPVNECISTNHHLKFLFSVINKFPYKAMIDQNEIKSQ